MENNKVKEARLVFNFGMARRLLKLGCTMVDIKEDRTNAETGKERTIFAFKNDEHFQECFAQLKKELAEMKNKEEEKVEEAQ